MRINLLKYIHKTLLECTFISYLEISLSLTYLRKYK